MKTLAIETSCDDTSIWIINFDWTTFTVDKLLAYSQVREHNEFVWVVPEIASRLHSEKIIAVLTEIWRDNIKNVDFISVTTHPGLPWSLVVWETVANLLGEYFDKKVIKINHIVWHVLALLLERNVDEIEFPMMVLTASGGHNNIYYIRKNLEWLPVSEDIKQWPFTLTKIGQTLDDAAGECFDKVSRMLGWPYPWGLRISQQAALWHPNKEFELHRIWLDNDKFEFSFSGTKAQMNQIIRKQEEKVWRTDNIFSEDEIHDIAYEFQESVVEILAKKLIRAAIKYDVKTIWLSGWVSANDRLKEAILELLENEVRLKNQIHEFGTAEQLWNFKPKLFTPAKKVYCTDNAAMIWVAGILSNE